MRLVKVPGHAPRYDGDLPGRVEAGFSGSAYATELWKPAGTALRAGLARSADAVLAGPAGASARGAAAALGPAGAGATVAWPRQLALVMAEILAGVRPVRQVVPWATDHAVAQIRDLIPRFASDRRPRIRRVVTSQPATTAVEVTVVAAFGPRTRAVAMRFEQIAARQAAPGLPSRPARWLCTAIEAG